MSIELQDVFKQYGPDFLKHHSLNKEQLKAYNAILNCRTAALGGHVLKICDACGYEEHSYNSCRNRHCPKCQTLAKEQWIEKQSQDLLDVGYFHVVFTLPEELNPVLFQNKDVTYSLFFKAVSETLLELGHDKNYLGGLLGVTAVLHTWSQSLLFHPHIHCIVPGGGLSDEKKWVSTSEKFFIPVKVLSKKFRGKFLYYLRRAKLSFYGSASTFNDPIYFADFISQMYEKDWITYCKPPFENASKVVQYLGRYTHRVAISNNRILKLENGLVTFNWRDYKDGNRVNEMTVTAEEFIRRFMLHILPSGFRKIRQYGLLAPRVKSKLIALCKRLTNTLCSQVGGVRKTLEILKELFGDKFNLCPQCGIGHLKKTVPRAAPVVVIE